MGDELEEVRAFWNRIAADWQIQVGHDGDQNRRLNSDPVLWELVGDVSGLDVLDAGCGTGYLTRELARRGARVVGVDVSERMIEIAKSSAPELDVRVDSVTALDTLDDERFDRVVSNYVLMDVPALRDTLGAFYRVLRPGGAAVLVFSHPCFPQGMRTEDPEGRVAYVWAQPYFEPHKVVEPPWGHFTSDFIWFHRPLSDYWKAFRTAGFVVTHFEEPRLTPDRYALARSARELERARTRPYSVAFRLEK